MKIKSSFMLLPFRLSEVLQGPKIKIKLNRVQEENRSTLILRYKYNKI